MATPAEPTERAHGAERLAAAAGCVYPDVFGRRVSPYADYHGLLQGRAAALLGAHPELAPAWQKDSATLVLWFPRRSDSGFDVGIAAVPWGVTVTAAAAGGGASLAFERGTDPDPHAYPSPGALVADALGLVGDLLGAGMRLRVTCAGGAPYRWHVESRGAVTGDGAAAVLWLTEGSVGRLAWPFWRRRTERVYQNDSLPRRHRLGGRWTDVLSGSWRFEPRPPRTAGG